MEIRITGDAFSRCERALMRLRRDQMPYAVARALTDTARDCQRGVTAELPTIFDRPTPFTERAIGSLAARRDVPVATVFVKRVQAKYLLREEVGGTRTAAANTRKPAQALVLPGAGLPLDQYGNIAPGTLAKLRREARRRGAARRGHRGDAAPVDDGANIAFLPASAPGNKAGIGGYFRRLPGHGLQRLTAFEGSTQYQPRLGFHTRVERIAHRVFAAHLTARFAEALRSAR